MSQSKLQEASDMSQFENMSIEELFEKAEKTVDALSDPDLSLEDSFREYEKGVLVMKMLSEKLSGVEERIKKITGDGVIEDFG